MPELLKITKEEVMKEICLLGEKYSHSVTAKKAKEVEEELLRFLENDDDYLSHLAFFYLEQKIQDSSKKDELRLKRINSFIEKNKTTLRGKMKDVLSYSMTLNVFEKKHV
jgi:proteasome assembly chaperone (PAC2) family protein